MSVITICKENPSLRKKKKAHGNNCLVTMNRRKYISLRLTPCQVIVLKDCQVSGHTYLTTEVCFCFRTAETPKWCNPQRKTDRPWDIPKTQMTHETASNQGNYLVYYPARIQRHKTNAQITASLWAKQEWNVTKIFPKKKSFQKDDYLHGWREERWRGTYAFHN